MAEKRHQSRAASTKLAGSAVVGPRGVPCRSWKPPRFTVMFACDVCAKPFSSKMAVCAHMSFCRGAPLEGATFPEQASASSFACPKCGKLFPTQRGCNVHIGKYCKGQEEEEKKDRRGGGCPSKPVMQLDVMTGRVIRVWPSGTAAAQELGVSNASISKAANHRLAKSRGGIRQRRTEKSRVDWAHGYLWRFVKDATKAERDEYAGQDDSSDDDDADEQAGSGGEAAYENGDRDAQAGMSDEEEQHKPQAGSSQFVHSVVSRPVEQIDPKTLEVIRQWPSVSAAGSALSLFSSNISEAARGKRVTAGKYRWRFVSDEPELASKPSSKLELASKPSSKPEKKKKPASRPAPKVEKVKAEAAPILNEDAFVTAIVCDECEGEFELDPTQVHLVPDGDWFCPSCTAAKEDAKMKAAEHMDLELVDEYNIGATKCAPGPDSSRNDLGASSPYIGARFVDDGHTWQVARIEWSAKLRCEVAYYFDVEAGDGVWEFSDLREVRE